MFSTSKKKFLGTSRSSQKWA